MSYVEKNKTLISLGLTRPYVEKLTKQWRPRYDPMMPGDDMCRFIGDFIREWKSCSLNLMGLMTRKHPYEITSRVNKGKIPGVAIEACGGSTARQTFLYLEGQS